MHIKAWIKYCIFLGCISNTAWADTGLSLLNSEHSPTVNSSINRAEPIQIGSMITLQSDILGESRQIQIALPASYPDYPDQHYPVLYLLDGESNFHYITGLMNRLMRGSYPIVPEMIVVGIINTDRTRDLTPSVVTPESVDVAMRGRIGTKNGGNSEFFAFMEEELMPEIKNRYRINDFKIMIGHSFGGITALNHLLNGHQKMNAYIVHDPSIWWDNGEMSRRYEAFQEPLMHVTKLFITQAGDGKREGKAAHYGSISRFSQYLELAPIPNLETSFVVYPEEDHGSVILKGNIDGLRSVFEDFRVDLKLLPDNPDFIQTQYQRLSDIYGMTIVPSEPMLVGALSYLQHIQREDLVLEMQAYIIDLYPEGNTAKSLNMGR